MGAHGALSSKRDGGIFSLLVDEHQAELRVDHQPGANVLEPRHAVDLPTRVKT